MTDQDLKSPKITNKLYFQVLINYIEDDNAGYSRVNKKLDIGVFGSGT